MKNQITDEWRTRSAARARAARAFGPSWQFVKLALADLRFSERHVATTQASADAAVEAAFHLKEAAKLTWRAAQLVDPSRWRLPHLVLLAPKVRGAAERAGALATEAEDAAIAALRARRSLERDAFPAPLSHELRRAMKGPAPQGLVHTPEARTAGGRRRDLIRLARVHALADGEELVRFARRAEREWALAGIALGIDRPCSSGREFTERAVRVWRSALASMAQAKRA